MDEQSRQATRQWTLAQPIVSAYVTSVVRDFSARDDVLQEIAIAVIDSFRNYDPTRPFVGWALGIAQNQVGLYLRRVRRDRHHFDEEMARSLADSFAEVAAEPSPELSFLRDCLSELEGRAKQLCDLRYQHDLKPAAIGQAVGMSANSVAKALQRIREQLRSCIDRKTASAGACS